MIPLLRAYLCLDCDVCFDGGPAPLVCPQCAGRIAVPIARWLNRPTVITAREVLALADELSKEQLEADVQRWVPRRVEGPPRKWRRR